MNGPATALAHFGLGVVSGAIIDNVFQWISLGDDDPYTETLELAGQVLANGMILPRLVTLGVEFLDPGEYTSSMMTWGLMLGQPCLQTKAGRLVKRIKHANIDAINEVTDAVNSRRPSGQRAKDPPKLKADAPVSQ